MSHLYRLLIMLFGCIVVAACSSTADFVRYENPSAEHITLQGTIDNKFSYSFGVLYGTRSKLKMCMKYGMNTGWGPSYKGFEYFPTIKNGKYQISIPLMELDPNTKCQWKPTNFQICAKLKSQPRPKFYFNCSILFYAYDERREGDFEIGEPMDVYCDPKTFICLRKPNWPIKVFKVFYIKEYNRSYTINISTKAPARKF